jgi:predicted nucleotide-binding protein
LSRLLFVEDDEYFAQHYQSEFEDAGFQVIRANDATVGWLAFEEDPGSFGAIVMDMAMPPGALFSKFEARSGFHAGLALSRRILRLRQDVRLIGLTGLPDDQITRWFKDKHLPLLVKRNTTSKQLLDHVMIARPFGGRPARQCFIVHGHDSSAVDELKIFIEQELDGYAPVVLAESRSGSLTVIEKLEEYLETAFIVFVLMTPDDQVVDAGGRTIARRARQNVIFELGYFLGRLGRSSGRILILTKGDVEIPSDIAGIVRIDISAGVSKNAKEILRELKDW